MPVASSGQELLARRRGRHRAARPIARGERPAPRDKRTIAFSCEITLRGDCRVTPASAICGVARRPSEAWHHWRYPGDRPSERDSPLVESACRSLDHRPGDPAPPHLSFCPRRRCAIARARSAFGVLKSAELIGRPSAALEIAGHQVDEPRPVANSHVGSRIGRGCSQLHPRVGLPTMMAR